MKNISISFLLWLVCICQVHASFSDPHPVGLDETWFLKDWPSTVTSLSAERWNWRSRKTDRFEVELPPRDKRGKPHHYAMAATASGLFIAGNRLAFLQKDGTAHYYGNFFPDPPERGMNAYEEGDQHVLVALTDDTALLLSKLRGDTKGKAFLLRWQAPIIKVQALTGAPPFNYGISATRLADGRVLIVSGYASQDKTWLYDPRSNRWTETGRMSVGRMYPALAALPDGRAFVAGSSWIATSNDGNQARFRSVHGAEIWDPATGQWSALPNLPMSFKIVAYGATGPSATVMPDGSLVLGGAMHKRLLILHATAKDFAPYWRISEPLSAQRIGGIVQAIGNNEVAISGGAVPWDNGQCCYIRVDGERLALPRPGSERQDSLSLHRADAAIAHRGDLSFAAGGWESFSLSFGTTQANAVAELIDHRSGRVRDLPSLPQPLLTGTATWVDDDRVLVKAIAHRGLYEQPFRGMDGRSLEFDSSGFLALYSLRRNAWETLNDPRIAHTKLAGIAHNKAYLIDEDARFWAVALDTLALSELPGATQARLGGTRRLQADGRLIQAGGQTQSELMEAFDADCRRDDCPLRPFAYGPLLPSRNHEIFNLTSGRWALSKPSQSAGESAAILRDGRVITLGRTGAQTSPESPVNQGRWLIEASDPTGKEWHQLPFPKKFDPKVCGDNPYPDNNCLLLLGALPVASVEAVLFMRSHWNADVRENTHDIWLLDEGRGTWSEIARDLLPDQLLSKKIKLRSQGGKTLYGTGFKPQLLRLSLE